MMHRNQGEVVAYLEVQGAGTGEKGEQGLQVNSTIGMLTSYRECPSYQDSRK